MGILYDIYYINWIKAAFVASLRELFSPAGIAYLNMPNNLNSTDTNIIYTNETPENCFLVGDLIQIDDEIMRISNIDTTNKILTVIRGVENTFPANHLNNSKIIKSYVPMRYLYDNDESLTKIQIYTAFPIRNFKAPTIVVNANSGDSHISMVGPHEQIGEKIIDGIPYLNISGILKLSIGIDIYASTMTDVEKLSDIIIILLRFFLRDKLAELRLTYTNIRFDNISTTEWNGEVLYKSSISISNVHSEYELIFPKSILPYIEKINIIQRIKDYLNEEEIIITQIPK